MKPSSRVRIVLGFVVLFLAVYLLPDLGIERLLPAWVSLVLVWHPQAWHGTVLAIGLLLFGLSRGVIHHPAYSPSYRRWLQETPWTSEMPLPFGPVHLIWTDAVVLAGGVVLAMFNGPAAWTPLIAFGIGYLITAGITISNSKEPIPAIVLLFGWGAVIRFFDTPAAVLAILIAMYVVFVLNLRSSLVRFSFVGLKDRLIFPSGILGWPFDGLKPIPSEIRATWPATAIGAMVAGWLVYAIDVRLRLMDPNDRGSAGVFVFGAGLAFFLGRLVRYKLGYSSPRPIWARLVTGNLIAPSHDIVFLTPVAIVVAATLLSLGAPSARSAFVPAYLGASIFVLVLIAFGGGPSLANWQLTGGHRITPSSSYQSKQQTRLRTAPTGTP